MSVNSIQLWNRGSGGNRTGWEQLTFGGEPAVVIIEPADLGADVERTTDRVELVVGTRDLGAYKQ
jgi:hypothetical protein